MNAFDNLGSGTEAYATTPTRVAGGLLFDQVAEGSAYGCGVADGDAYCWGGVPWGIGLLGTGEEGGSSEPKQVVGELDWDTVVPMDANNIYGSTCGLTLDGEAYCWGSNRYGQLGSEADDSCSGPPTDRDNGTTACSTKPAPVVGALKFVSLAVGLSFACGAGQNGNVHCWGLNDSGQLGDGTTTDRSAPVRVQLPSVP